MLIGIMMIILTLVDDACLMIVIMMFVTVAVITIDFDECIFFTACWCWLLLWLWSMVMLMNVFSQHVGREAGGGSPAITCAWLNDLHKAGPIIIIMMTMIDLEHTDVIMTRRHPWWRPKSAKAHSGASSHPGNLDETIKYPRNASIWIFSYGPAES